MLYSKKILFVFLLSQVSLMGQSYKDSLLFNLYKNYPEFKVEELRENIIKITYPDGQQVIKNIEKYIPPPLPNDIGYTLINLTNIDTMEYYWKYKLWQQIELTNSRHRSVKTGDVNENSLAELYGFQYLNDIYPTVVFEKDRYDYFNLIYTYPEHNGKIMSIYDVDQDGDLEVQIKGDLSTSFTEFFYEKPAEDSLATSLKFAFNPNHGVSNAYLGQFDGDTLTDMIYEAQDIWILEYNPDKVNFDTVYLFEYSWPTLDELLGFGIGDFDQDRKLEFTSGDVYGTLVVFENNGDNIYDSTWSGTVDANMAYTHSQTNDIDKNGRPE